MDIQIGKVLHYYDKIGVAIVEAMNQALKAGDTVRISGHDNEFTQKIESLQVEHNHVDKLEPGESGGMKVEEKVKEGDILYLVTS